MLYKTKKTQVIIKKHKMLIKKNVKPKSHVIWFKPCLALTHTLKYQEKRFSSHPQMDHLNLWITYLEYRINHPQYSRSSQDGQRVFSG